MYIKRISLLMLLLLTYTSGVKAQYVWQLSHNNVDFRYGYSFTAISSYGNNTCVTCSLEDKLRKIYTNVIFRSTDGGEHWIIQDPALDWRVITEAPLLVTIQQIDSLNIVAAGDSGLIVRSFDGGATWEKQDCNTILRITSVHFSNPMVGIATAYTYDFIKSIFTTTDGGRHWKPANYILGLSLTGCYSYGGERFSVFEEGHGKIISTKDNWKTVTTITDFVDSTQDDPEGQYYTFNNCNFTGGDTICVMGGYNYYGKIVRSVDGGKHWERPYSTLGSTIKVMAMSSLDRDTVLAGVQGYRFVYLSSDRGRTWRPDTLVTIDSATPVERCYGLCWVNKGPIAIFGTSAFQYFGGGIILTGLSHPLGIRREHESNISGNIYPNPATTEVTILPSIGSQYITVFDVLGKIVFHERCTSDGSKTFDLRHLPKGFYSAYGEENGRSVPIGKFIITGGN